MKNIKFVKETISSLNKKLFDEKTNLYNLHYNIKSKKVDKTITAFVEAHCIHCLYKLGYKKQAKNMLSALLNSKLFDKNKFLFRFSMRNNKLIYADKNTCSNLLILRNLINLNFKEIEELKKSINNCLFDKKKGLYIRSSKDRKLFVAQTNLWAVQALESLGKYKEAKILLKNIIRNFYDKKQNCIVSKSGTKKSKYSSRYIFSDDNFLFCYIAYRYYPELCKKISKTIINSDLYDKSGLFNRSIRLNDNFLNIDKSAYKNAICLLGLKSLGKEFSKYARKLEKSMIGNLYNKKAKLFMDGFSDSNLLACLAISI